MPSKKSAYPVGALANAVKNTVSKYTGGIYRVDEVVKQVQLILPEAKRSSIRGLLIFEYKKRGWARPTNDFDIYKLTENFGKKMKYRTRKSKSKKDVIEKSPDDELTFVEIGRGIVAYVNELKTLADIAEEENVKLTKQVNKLQDAFNKMKMEGNGSIHVRDLKI